MDIPSTPVTAIIVGYGSRGSTYARYALENPSLLKIIGIAEPREFIRSTAAKKHSFDIIDIPNKSINTSPTSFNPSPSGYYLFSSWEEIVQLPQKIADCVIICTQDQMHTEPTVQLSSLGYHILLEKPMAPSRNQCINIVESIQKHNVLFAVGHVLRYTPYMQNIIKLLRSNSIGQIINIQHLEPIGNIHFSHSFVRGNWRKEQDSSFLLMTKCCHDIDLIRYMMNNPCLKISSMGNLTYFKSESQPTEATQAKRCIDCPIEKECCWSSKKIYLEPAEQIVKTSAHTGAPVTFPWPMSILLDKEHTVPAIEEAITNGPYGRCVFHCDNDVVDHQVVSMEFMNGTTATLTTTAFTKLVCQRQTKIFGTLGEITGTCLPPDLGGDHIIHYDYLSRKETKYSNFLPPSNTALIGHGGADYYLIQAFIKAVSIATGKVPIDIPQQNTLSPEELYKYRMKIASTYILSGPEESLDSHLMVFAAEEARKNNTIISMNEFLNR